MYCLFLFQCHSEKSFLEKLLLKPLRFDTSKHTKDNIKEP